MFPPVFLCQEISADKKKDPRKHKCKIGHEKGLVKITHRHQNKAVIYTSISNLVAMNTPTTKWNTILMKILVFGIALPQKYL